MRAVTPRTLVGLIAVLALVVGTAAPAPAVVVVGSAGSGELRLAALAGGPTIVLDFGAPPPLGAPCPPPAGPATVGIDFDGLGGTTVVTVLAKFQVELFPGNWYWFNLSLGTGPKTGTIAGGVLTQALSLRITFHRITTTPADCNVKTPSVCTLMTDLALTGTWPWGPVPAPGDTVALSGGPAPIKRAGACSAPMATWFPATPPMAQAHIPAAAPLALVF